MLDEPARVVFRNIRICDNEIEEDNEGTADH